jgi:parallel beta-helix repeat protein
VGKSKILNNTIEGNTEVGLLLKNTYNNLIESNTITGSNDGMLVADSYDNTVHANKIADNSNGINLGTSIKNNLFYHNEFLNNQIHITASSLSNDFSTEINGTMQGNYWESISRADINDSNNDGYGDSGTNYPLKQSTAFSRIGTGVSDEGPILNREVLTNVTFTDTPSECALASLPAEVEDSKLETDEPQEIESSFSFWSWQNQFSLKFAPIDQTI